MSAHNERAHAILGASSSGRWLKCPGSVRLNEQAPPQKFSEYAALGTAAHDLAEKVLKTKTKNAIDYKGKKINSFEVDLDMIQAVQVYVDLIREESKGFEVDLEKRFSLEWLHKGMFGTNDASFGEPFGTLNIYDYKHGAGIAVEAENNTQMLYYALGASYDPDTKDLEDYEEIRMVIVQPRAFHEDGPIRSWTISRDELLEWKEKIKAGAIATEDPNAPFNPSDDACRWCNAAGFCPALNQKTQEIAKTDFGDTLPDAEAITIEQAAKVVAHKKMLSDFVEACEARIEEEMITNKKTLKGLKVVRKRGATIWNDEGMAEKVLAKEYGDKIYNKKIKTPNQMEKALGKDATQDLFQKVEGGFTIAPESDRRKEVNLDPKLDFE